MTENISKKIGKNICKFRRLNNMTREELAEEIGLDTAYLGQCERGERQLGLTKTLEVIDYFGITPNDIIPVNPQKRCKDKEAYLEKINSILEGCSDNQLLAILHCIEPLVTFLKD